MKSVPLLPWLLLTACAAAPPAPGPQGDDSAVVAIAVRTRDGANQRSGRPETIYFVRLEEGADPASAGPVLTSNYSFGNVVCLLDAEPGSYVAVGGNEHSDGRDWTTYFSSDFIRATRITVGPRGFGFMGSFTQNVLRATAKPEPAQSHYETLISPGWLSKSAATKLFTRYRFSYGRAFTPTGKAAEEEARLREQLARSGWGDRFPE